MVEVAEKLTWTWACQRADGSTFTVEVPSSTHTLFTFEDACL